MSQENEQDFGHMSSEPPTSEEIGEWYDLQAKLKTMKAREMQLRLKLANFFFPENKRREGTNNLDMPDNWQFKLGHVINRSVNEGLLQALQPQLSASGIMVGLLIERKPSLIISAYRQLTDEQRALFDQCLSAKPGSPSLELVIPKRRGKPRE